MNPENILAQQHLKGTTACSLSSRLNGDHHHEENKGEGGLGKCLIGKNLVTSPAQPYTGYQKASAREADRRTPGDER